MRPTTNAFPHALHRLAWPAFALLALAVLLVWRLAIPPLVATAIALPSDAPPWRHGAADARFTLTVYADLECPHCKTYVPLLTTWIDQHPEAQLLWHHLPLPDHEPAASALAGLAECAGATGGPAAFWQAVAWLYAHTRSGGIGLPEGSTLPHRDAALAACLHTDHPRTIVHEQALEATQAGINATPTLRVHDNATGKTLILQGPVEGDALLSALDMLAAGESGHDSP